MKELVGTLYLEVLYLEVLYPNLDDSNADTLFLRGTRVCVSFPSEGIRVCGPNCFLSAKLAGFILIVDDCGLLYFIFCTDLARLTSLA